MTANIEEKMHKLEEKGLYDEKELQKKPSRPIKKAYHRLEKVRKRVRREYVIPPFEPPRKLRIIDEIQLPA